MSEKRNQQTYQYIHGGDIYRNPVEYDFSVNVNPLGMPKKSLEAAQRAVLLCGRYPDWRGEALCRKIAEREGVREGQVLLGCGAAELIYALCYYVRRLCFSEHEAADAAKGTDRTGGAAGKGPGKTPLKGLMAAPSFGEYEAALLAAGGQPVFWRLKEEKDFKLEEEFAGAVTEEIGIVFLCNPNNPTGSLTDRELLLKIAEKCEKTKTYFCLDECFLPFLERDNERSLKGMLERFPHLIILRAFTKIYGMPGLRLGYAMTADEELIKGMRSCMQPWSTSIPAQAAGVEALQDEEYLERTRRLICREREYLVKELEAGLAKKVYPSGANYIFFRSRADLKELLMKEKILIRSCSNYRNLGEGYFRIGIRTHEENRALIERWRRAAAKDGTEPGLGV